MKAFQIMPDLSPEEYKNLKQDIATRGVLVPVEYDEDGNTLDGHHREKICKELGITHWPKIIREGLSEEEKRIHARQLNIARRHLSQEQRQTLILEQLKETPERSDRQIAQDLGVSNSTVSLARKEAVQTGDVCESHTSTDTMGRQQPRNRQPKSYRYVDDSPEGEDAVTQTAKDIRARKAKENAKARARMRTEALKLELPPGKYRTIIIDPPWPMQKIERDFHPDQVGFDYPTMSEKEIQKLDVPGMAHDQSHLFLWTTQKFMPMALSLMDQWGFPYIFEMVWHKPGGFQPFGLPQYNCEFVLFGRRGALGFTETKAFSTCFQASRREHSRKPDEFYDLIRRVCPGPRIDVFSREQRVGFDTWGVEAEKFGGAP